MKGGKIVVKCINALLIPGLRSACRPWLFAGGRKEVELNLT